MIALTGSRYFGRANEESDYDFFMEDSTEARRHLLANGFLRLPAVGRCGPNTAAIYRKGNVDIGLVKNISRKLWEQKVLSTTPAKVLMRVLPKRGRIFVWNIVQQL